MKKITIVLILSISSICYGQYGWTRGELYLKDSTVLEGFIKIPKPTKNAIDFSNQKKIKFRVEKDQKTKKYIEKNIDKIIFNDGSLYRFISTTKKKKLLCKFVSEGNVTLYTQKVSYAQSTPMYSGTAGSGQWVNTYNGQGYVDEYYALKKEDKMAFPIVKYGLGSAFKKNALAYFSDCASVITKIKDKTYKKKDIIELVTEYNKCSK